MPEIGEHEVGNFLVSVQRWEKHYAVLVNERKAGQRFYVNLVEDPRFDWFGWRHKVATFETHLSADHLIEYNDRVSTQFHGIRMPVQRMSGSSVDRLLDLCEKITKAQRKARSQGT